MGPFTHPDTQIESLFTEFSEKLDEEELTKSAPTQKVHQKMVTALIMSDLRKYILLKNFLHLL